MQVSGERAIGMTSTVVASDQQVSCDVADESVLLSIQSSEYFGLNPVAASVWRLIQQPRRLMDVRNALMLEYTDVSAETCEAELLDFVRQLVTLALVTIM